MGERSVMGMRVRGRYVRMALAVFLSALAFFPVSPPALAQAGCTAGACVSAGPRLVQVDVSLRKDAPVKPADDAIWIDTTRINQNQMLAKAIEIVEARKGAPKVKKAPAKKSAAKKPNS